MARKGDDDGVVDLPGGFAIRRAKPKGARQFSLAAFIRAQMAETFESVDSDEHQATDYLNRLCGGPPRGAGYRVPAEALRDLSVASDGSLVDHQLGDYLDALRPASMALSFGVRTETADPGQLTIPKGANPVTVQWLADETDAVDPGQPSFAAANSTPKIACGFFRLSRQLLLQSNAEEVARRELRNAAASALDRAIFQGTGASGQPLGILATPDVGTFDGTDLDVDALRAAQKAVTVEAADQQDLGASVAYAASPDVSELLSTRERFTGGGLALWQGKSVRGVVEGCPAGSSSNIPDATMIFGSWQHVTVVTWSGGLVLAIDPYTDFGRGLVGMRFLLYVDVIVTRPQGFAVATEVS